MPASLALSFAMIDLCVRMVEAGAAPEAALLLGDVLGAGAGETVVAIDPATLASTDGSIGVPSVGEIVQVDGGSWQLMVTHAVLSEDVLLLAGVQGGGIRDFDWAVYQQPRLVAQSPGGGADCFGPRSEAWSPEYEVDADLLLRQGAAYGQLLGVPFVPLSVREGGWRERFEWRRRRLRERVALRVAPWLGPPADMRRRSPESGIDPTNMIADVKTGPDGD